MTEPQTWVMIGVFTTIMIGGMTLMTTLINRATANAIDGVNAKIDGLRGEMNARFDAVNEHIHHIDRDVSVVMRRMWGEPGPTA